MWKWAVLGAGLIVTGAVKFSDHLAALGRQARLEDYLALRCLGGAEAEMAAGAHAVWAHALMHCWGCYAMVVGAAMLVFSLASLVRPARAPARLR